MGLCGSRLGCSGLVASGPVAAGSVAAGQLPQARFAVQEHGRQHCANKHRILRP
jgi:hypothetical protein